MPSPVGLVVKKGWNSLSLISGEMPVPLSRTVMATASPPSRVATARVGLERPVAAVAGTLVGGIEAVAEQVEEDAHHLLWRDLDRREAGLEIALQGDVEALVLRPGAVISEVERLIDEGVEVDLAALALTPRECSSIDLTMLSARLPCSAILSRLPVSSSIVSSISARVSASAWP